MHSYRTYTSDTHHYQHHHHHQQQHTDQIEEKPLMVDLITGPYPNKVQTPPSSNSPSDCLSSPENSLNGSRNNNNSDITNDPSVRRYRTAFTRDQLACLEKEFFKENYVSRNRRLDLSKQLGLPEATIKVWFQNRRMKDKRQRIAVAWPYAAVYSDPAFAASILQAAANSVGIPYATPYPAALANPMLSAIPPAMPLSSHPATYGQYRYNPYHLTPSRPQPPFSHHMGPAVPHHMASASIPVAAMLNATMPVSYNATKQQQQTPPLNLQCTATMPSLNTPMQHATAAAAAYPPVMSTIYTNNKQNTPPQDLHSSSSPHSSTLSLSPPSDHDKVYDCTQSTSPTQSIAQNFHQSLECNSEDNNNNTQTSTQINTNKRPASSMSPDQTALDERQPKLFKPYKTEA